MSVAGGEPRQLTRGGTEELRNGELDWVYPEELDLETAYWWSPDSSKIAFLQLDERPVEKYPLVDALSYGGELTEERYPVAGSPNPVARVGVVDVAGGDVRWMDTGGDATALLARVEWLPDSRRVAIERLNRVQNHLDLLFADAATGKCADGAHRARQVLDQSQRRSPFSLPTASASCGPANAPVSAIFISTILSGKQLAQLTHGDWEVENVAGVDEQAQARFISPPRRRVPSSATSIAWRSRAASRCS